MSEKPRFATPFAMKCNYDQFESVKDRLIIMGYFIQMAYQQTDFDSERKVLATNVTGENGRFYPLHDAVAMQYGRILIEEWNEELCLALAAMTDHPVKYIKGEYICCTHRIGNFNPGNLLKMDCEGEPSADFWRKATAQELISHFTKERVITPEADQPFEKKPLQPGEMFSYESKGTKETGNEPTKYIMFDDQESSSTQTEDFILKVGLAYFGTSGAYMPSHKIKVIKENGEIVGVRVDVDTAEVPEPEYEEKDIESKLEKVNELYWKDLTKDRNSLLKETMERQSKVPDYREAYNKLTKQEDEWLMHCLVI